MTSPINGAQIVAAAESWLGVPYNYGGGRGTAAQARQYGLDCSGLTYQIFAALGVNIGGDTVAQMNNPAGMVIPDGSEQPGDLIFFGLPTGGTQEHVGIYIGNGYMISAPHTGASVRIDNIATWGEPIIGIRRFATGTTSAPSSLDGITLPNLGNTASPGGSSSSGGISGVTSLLVTLAAVAAAAGLVVLGVSTLTKDRPNS